MEKSVAVNRISCQPINFGALSTEDEDDDDDVFESPTVTAAHSPSAIYSSHQQQHLNLSDLRVRKDAQTFSDRFSSSLSTNKSNASAASPAMADPLEEILHKTILVGDSGVGKTSLLVQFDTGKFQQGSFAATVGIGFTIMLLGDSGVGKTCLLVRFRDGAFLSGTFIATVGIDFRNKVLDVDGSRVKLQIWDTAGQERFRSVTHAYYRDAHALLLLYDVTNSKSFENTRAWLAEISEYAHKDVVIILIGNKCDSEQRVVKREDGERLAREFNVTFLETSAKTGTNVEQAFMQVARCLKNRQTNVPESPIFTVKEYVDPSNIAARSSCTCNTA